jgi:peptide/nickel transport system substrate-binding protein
VLVSRLLRSAKVASSGGTLPRSLTLPTMKTNPSLLLVTWIAIVPGCKRSASRFEGQGPIVVRCPESGCSAESGERVRRSETGGVASPKKGGELVVRLESEPASLCDLIDHEAFTRWIMENQVNETLLYQDPWTGELSPRLAERIEETNSRITITLRAGVRFHDGVPLSAADVAFTLAKARDPKVGADVRSDLEPVHEVEAPDPRTVVLSLSRPAPFLRQALAHLSILPRHLFDGKELRRAPALRAPMGTGPFRFVEWKAGERIVLERNEEYWGTPPYLDRVVFRIVRDQETAYELYRRGELDVLWRLPSLMDRAIRDPELTGHLLLRWIPRAYQFIVWNVRRGPLKDPRVRQALTMLINRHRYLDVVYQGRAREISGPYAVGTPSYDPQIAPWPYDPQRARALLEEAGVRDLHLDFLVTAGSKTFDPLATMLKEDLAAAHVTLNVTSVDFAVQLDRLRRHAFDLSALQWTLSLEQDNYSIFHSSQPQNYGDFHSTAADALLEEIRQTPSDDVRHRLDRKLHRLLHDEQPYTFLCAPEVATLMGPRVHGLSPSIDGFSLTRAWVDKR